MANEPTLPTPPVNGQPQTVIMSEKQVQAVFEGLAQMMPQQQAAKAIQDAANAGLLVIAQPGQPTTFPEAPVSAVESAPLAETEQQSLLGRFLSVAGSTVAGAALGMGISMGVEYLGGDTPVPGSKTAGEIKTGQESGWFTNAENGPAGKEVATVAVEAAAPTEVTPSVRTPEVLTVAPTEVTPSVRTPEVLTVAPTAESKDGGPSEGTNTGSVTKEQPPTTWTTRIGSFLDAAGKQVGKHQIGTSVGGATGLAYGMLSGGGEWRQRIEAERTAREGQQQSIT